MFKKTSDKDPLKIKIDLQKSLLQRKVYDKPLNGVGTTKISHSHSVSSYHLPKNQSPNVNNFFPGTERNIKPIIHNNININVHNLYVTNEKLEHYLHYAKDYQKIGMNGLALGSSTKVKTNNIGLIKVKNLFSKIGSDIISKSQSVKKLNINNNPIKYRLKQPVPKYNNFPSHNNSNSVINNSQINENNQNIKGNKRLRIDLTEQNKDVEFNNSINSSSLLIDKEKDLSFINKSSIKETYIKVNGNTIQANSKLWEIFFELELNLENKLYLTSSLNKLLFFLYNEFLGIKINIDLDIFSLSILSTQYKKLMKLSIICLMYIKFLLNDFNFEMALKIAVKNLLYNFNDALLLLLKQVIFIGEDSMKLTDNPKCSLIGNECVAFYMKLIKIHKIKKLNESINTFNITLLKKVEGIVLLLKQFTNNYFKNGYFRPIHSISIELLKQIDTYNIEHVIKIIENGVLFYLMNSNLSNSKNNNDENNIVTQTASGFHPNGTIPVSVPSFPYLPPLDRKKDVYTLVLDLDETLVHYYYTPKGGNFLIRPYCFEFLQNLHELFEIVIFTAGTQDYADTILNVMDPTRKYIKYRLYRNHTSIYGLSFVKDLEKLGRDLARTMIVDNLQDNFRLQPNNGIPIKTWNDDMNDNELNHLCKFLKQLYTFQIKDVRYIIKSVREEFNMKMKKNAIYPYTYIDFNKFFN